MSYRVGTRNRWARLSAHPEWQLAAIVLALATGWIIFAIYTHVVLEDAYITFRYAANLASGRGFVFNPGDRVLGTTTPLFTLLLAATARLVGTGPLPTVAMVYGVAAMAACLVFSYRMLEALGLEHPYRLAAVVLAGAHPDVLWSTIGGMETPEVLAAMSAAGYAFATRRPFVLGVASGCLVLLRPDGALWVCVLGLGLALGRQWKDIAIAAGAGAAIVLPWLLFAYRYFGSAVPHSVVAKRVIGTAAARSTSSEKLAAHAGWFLEKTGFHQGPPYERPFLAALSLVAVLGGIEIARRAPTAKILAVFPVVFVAAFTLGNAPTAFPWYVLPFAWSLTMLAGFGIRAVSHWIASGSSKKPLRLGLIFPVVMLALTSLGATWVAFTVWFERSGENQGFVRETGEWLRDNTPPESSVALEPIGYIGYFSERRVIDLAGLVSPEVVAIHRNLPPDVGSLPAVLSDLSPDYVVLRPFEVRENHHFYGGPVFESPRERSRFDESYRLVRTFRAAIPEDLGRLARLAVYCRRGEPCNAVGIGTGDGSDGVRD